MLFKAGSRKMLVVLFLSFMCGVLTLFAKTVDLKDLDYSRINR